MTEYICTWIPSTHVKLIHVSVVCFTIHSSSPKSRAELRFSGSHCNILRMRRKKHSLSSLSSPSRRVVSRSSSVLERGKGIPAEKSPLQSVSIGRESNGLDRFPLTFIREELALQIRAIE